MKKYHKSIPVVFAKTDSGFSAYSEEWPVFSTGDDIHELKGNLLEAINLFLEDREQYALEDQLILRLDLAEFFQYYRLLNAKALAKRIGMNPTLLSQYVQGKKRPSEKQSRRILEGVQKIGRELSSLEWK